MSYIIFDGTGREYLVSRAKIRALAADWASRGAIMERRSGIGLIPRVDGISMRASYVHVRIGKGSADIFRAIGEVAA